MSGDVKEALNLKTSQPKKDPKEKKMRKAVDAQKLESVFARISKGL